MPVFTIKQQAYAEIEAKFTCKHQSRQLRLRRIRDGRPAFYRQCTRCGNAGQAVSRAEAARELGQSGAPAFDDELEAKWFAQKHAVYVATYYAIKPRLEAEYRAYLSSPAWDERCAATIQRAHGNCECCQLFPAKQAHHLTYARIGQEKPEDLMAVCLFCHAVIHGKLAL